VNNRLSHQAIHVAIDAIASRTTLTPQDWAEVDALLRSAAAGLDEELGYLPHDSGFVDITLKDQ
jgi:hypothetical protein